MAGRNRPQPYADDATLIGYRRPQRAPVRNIIAPLAKLGVQVIEVAEAPGREGRGAQTLDLSLDEPLFIPAGRADQRSRGMGNREQRVR